MGNEVHSFSFPFGDMNKDLFDLSLSVGYRYICNSVHGFVKSNTSSFPRNSINSRMSWEDIEYILDPNISTRLFWKGEDLIKSSVKILLGDERYRKFRDFIK